MTTTVRDFSVSIRIAASYETAAAKLRDALKRHGLEILGEIPVDYEVERKDGFRWRDLGLHGRRHYTVLVVWSPSTVYQAILSDRDGGLLIPFNFSIADDGESTIIAVTNQYAAMNPRFVSIGVQVLIRDLAHKIRKVLAEVAGQEQHTSTSATAGSARRLSFTGGDERCL